MHDTQENTAPRGERWVCQDTSRAASPSSNKRPRVSPVMQRSRHAPLTKASLCECKITDIE